MPQEQKFTDRQRKALAELLIAGKRFWYAGPRDTEDAAHRLARAVQEFVQTVDAP